MSGIRITALTEKGKEAIQKHLVDKTKQPKSVRLHYAAIFKERVENNPYSLVMERRQTRVARYFTKDALASPIEDALAANGAYIGVDYEVTEYE